MNHGQGQVILLLLKALSDLVCISTACPCDVDPANGWNPTDIQIRTYSKDLHFKKSIGWRKTTEADMEQTKQTGFHSSFSNHTRSFVEYSGYWLPNNMTNHGVISEYWACREKAAIMDLSPLRKYESYRTWRKRINAKMCYKGYG